MPFLLLAQLISAAITIPLFLSLNWILTPITVFAGLDFRLTDLRWTRTILPSLVLGHYVPMYVAHFAPNLVTRHVAIVLWQFAPFWIGIIHWALSRCVRSTIVSDRLRAPLRDLGVIRFTVLVPAGVSMVTWLTTLARAPFNASEIFIPQDLLSMSLSFLSPTSQTTSTTTTDFPHLIGRFLQYDYIFLFGSVYIWLLYSFWDLHSAGMFKKGWTRFFAASLLATMVGGPSVACAGLFLWREQILATRKHWGAITRENLPVVKVKFCEKEIELEKRGGGGRFVGG